MNIWKGEYRLKWYKTDYEIDNKNVPRREDGDVYPGGVFRQKKGSIKDESYNPLEIGSPILLELYGVNERSENHILEFVNKYGTLGTRFVYHGFEQHTEDLVFDFKREVRQVKKLLGIYEALKDRDRKKMRKVLQLEKEDLKRLMLDQDGGEKQKKLIVPMFPFTRRRPREDSQRPSTRSLTVDEEPQFEYSYNPDDDILQTGSFYLCKVLNAYLADTALFINYENIKLKGHYLCDTLLGAIYLQMYLLVKENKNLERCTGCHTLFLPKRLNNQYCGESCRIATKQRTYRKRRRT
jgi:hypothetical protein